MNWNLTAIFAGISGVVKNPESTQAAILMPNGSFLYKDRLGEPIPEHRAVVRIERSLVARYDDRFTKRRRVFPVLKDGKEHLVFLLKFEDIQMPEFDEDLLYGINDELVKMSDAVGRECPVRPEFLTRPTVASDRIMSRVFLKSGKLTPYEKDEPRCVQLPGRAPQFWAAAVQWTSPEITSATVAIPLHSFDAREKGEETTIELRPGGEGTAEIEILNSMWPEIVGVEMDYNPDHFRGYYELGAATPPYSLPVPKLCQTGGASFCMHNASFSNTTIPTP